MPGMDCVDSSPLRLIAALIALTRRTTSIVGSCLVLCGCPLRGAFAALAQGNCD